MTHGGGPRPGRPRLFELGYSSLRIAVPEHDRRLVQLAALREDVTSSRWAAEAIWARLAAEGYPATFGIPDAERASTESGGSARECVSKHGAEMLDSLTIASIQAEDDA